MLFKIWRAEIVVDWGTRWVGRGEMWRSFLALHCSRKLVLCANLTREIVEKCVMRETFSADLAKKNAKVTEQTSKEVWQLEIEFQTGWVLSLCQIV